MTDWKIKDQDTLAVAIRDFKTALPGWWYSVGECQVTCDASCGPTVESFDILLIPHDRRFDDGFHVDLPNPSTLADALRHVMRDAQAAIKAVNDKKALQA